MLEQNSRFLLISAIEVGNNVGLGNTIGLILNLFSFIATAGVCLFYFHLFLILLLFDFVICVERVCVWL